MSSRMVSRGGKTRFIGFVCMILVLSAVLYVFHETQVELDGVRHSASSCSRQLESISSQLQVLVEQKLKLERSLEEEKRVHVKTKEDLNELIQDEKQLRDKQNVDYMIRYNELEQKHEETDKKLRLEMENLNDKYIKEVEVNKQLTKLLDEAKLKIQNFKNEKEVFESGKENVEKDQNNNLLKSNEPSEVQFVKKIGDYTTTKKLKTGSVTPAINPQAIDGATAKSSTPMINSKVVSSNESLVEKEEANPINQPSMDINSIKLPDDSPNEISPTQESQVGGNESMKAMPAPPQEEIVKKEQLNNVEEDKLAKQKNNSYKEEYEQEHFKEDEDDEDMNDFDAREDNQQHNNIRYTR